MASSEIPSKGRVSGPHLWFMFNTSQVLSFLEGRAAAGIHSSSPEGDGPGLCTTILAGGRSGGHQAAVMCAVRYPPILVECPVITDLLISQAFHPTLPLIATGGVGFSQS